MYALAAEATENDVFLKVAATVGTVVFVSCAGTQARKSVYLQQAVNSNAIARGCQSQWWGQQALLCAARAVQWGQASSLPVLQWQAACAQAEAALRHLPMVALVLMSCLLHVSVWPVTVSQVLELRGGAFKAVIQLPMVWLWVSMAISPALQRGCTMHTIVHAPNSTYFF